MIPESYSIYFEIRKTPEEIVGSMYQALKLRWPRLSGSIELNNGKNVKIADAVEGSNFESLKLKWAIFYRDQDMEERWDWGYVTSESFGGEGPVSITNLQDGDIELSLPEDPEEDSFSKGILQTFLSIDPKAVIAQYDIEE